MKILLNIYITPFKQLLILTVSLMSTTLLHANELVLSVPTLPDLVDSKDKGYLIDLAKAMGEAINENILITGPFPFKRSIENVITGKAHFHMPLLQDPQTPEEKLPFRFSTASINEVFFVLYTLKSSPLSKNSLSNTSKIETDRAHIDFFKHYDFKVSPSNAIENSLKKVMAERIDGYVFAALEVERVIKNNPEFQGKFKSELFQVYKGKMVLPKGPKGDALDKKISAAFETVVKNGQYEKSMGPYLEFYRNWAPRN